MTAVEKRRSSSYSSYGSEEVLNVLRDLSSDEENEEIYDNSYEMKETAKKTSDIRKMSSSEQNEVDLIIQEIHIEVNAVSPLPKSPMQSTEIGGCTNIKYSTHENEFVDNSGQYLANAEYIEQDDSSSPLSKKMEKIIESGIENTSTSAYDTAAISDNNSFIINKTSSRKRNKNSANWKCNIRNSNRQKGKEYIDIKGKLHPAKAVKSENCLCVFKCTENFEPDLRQLLHDNFWKLDDKSKNFYYAQFVKKECAKRKSKKAQLKKREFSYKYFFQQKEQMIRVCKKFFLDTLNISSKRIQWFFANKVIEVGVPSSPRQGKHVKKSTPYNKIEEIKKHINSFPRVESHYCRASTTREYLESNLNVQKMYNLYKECCDGQPLKKHMYAKVFNEQFNLSFYLPKKDQCDLCSMCKGKTNLSTIDKNKFNIHEKNQIYAKRERDKDRQNLNENVAIVTYDLQNVFTLPKAEISSFYYKRKFAVYNLTGHCNLNKTTYCSIWTEAQSGRSGNDLASALYIILKKVVQENPNINEITLWSDSCVAQNKICVNTTMMLKFMQENPQIISIHHKYSEPGHSQLQEIDAVHCEIDRHLRGITIYSPVSLLRYLLKMNLEKVHLNIMQMKNNEFLNFSAASKDFKNNMLPFLQVKYIKYNSDDLTTIEYKISLSETEPFQKIALCKNVIKRKLSTILVQPVIFNWQISEEKKKDLISMIKYMDISDITYYNTILDRTNSTQSNMNTTPKSTRRTTPKHKKN